ncbi:hypothetical protein [Marinicella rhabdoformis]|uniref:hypothetical protein n=1 Tax=Marinicella rhabdoformis TaxID=2580566 RepID=UPI0012AEC099|nr:hypothetical protein [Marinicella rhabdoformis]
MNNPLNNLLIILTLIVSYLASAQSPAEFFKTDIGAEYKICCGNIDNRNQHINSCFNAEEYSFYQKALEKKATIKPTISNQCMANFQSVNPQISSLQTLSKTLQKLTDDELARKRKEVNEQYNSVAKRVMCQSSGLGSLSGYNRNIKKATKKNAIEGGESYSKSELYFFLECGEANDYMSPLAYHANHLKLEDGKLSPMTKEIIDSSMEYIDVKDPVSELSFLDIARRNLQASREMNNSRMVGLYEDVLRYVEIRKDANIIAER